MLFSFNQYALSLLFLIQALNVNYKKIKTPIQMYWSLFIDFKSLKIKPEYSTPIDAFSPAAQLVQ